MAIMSNHADMIIVGAGLSGLLTAWRCLDVNPDLTVMVIDAADKIAGDHTWSFNLSDVPESLRDWIAPFIAYQWPRYEVKFPNRERTLEIPYCTGNSETLRACVQPFIDNGRLITRLGERVSTLSSESVRLESGEVLQAKCVLDARGFKPDENVFLGYQKFVGHVIKTPTPHGLVHPIIMDATVEQIGGYRFVYCLPYTETEMLVEDTYYTDGAELSAEVLDGRIADYIKTNLHIDEYETIRREQGVLPITLAVTEDAYHAQAIGIRGGFYHAVTGYSFPDALQIADALGFMNHLFIGQGAMMNTWATVKAGQEDHYKKETFFRLLNRMLFRAAKPQARYKVLERFYGLSEPLIKRFYAGKLTLADKLRILVGKPPVPIHKALYNFSEKAFITRERKRRESEKGL